MTLEGRLFSLPGGDVRGVVGAEWRRASLDIAYDNTRIRLIAPNSPIGSAGIRNSFALKGERTIQAVFTELFFPLLSKQNSIIGVRDLNVTVSSRHESSEGFSSGGPETESHYSSDVWSAGVVYRPIQPIALRFNKSTSYRVPDIAQSLFPPLLSPSFIIDVRSFPALFYDIDKISGGNPEIQPEESTSRTWGIQITPIEKLRFSVNWHETNFFNRIASLNPFAFFVSQTTMDYYGFQYTFGEDGRITRHDARANNIARIDTRGIDYALAYAFPVGSNTLAVSLNVAETKNHLLDLNTFDSEPAEEWVDAIHHKRRYSATVSWRQPGITMSLHAYTRSNLYHSELAIPDLNVEDPELIVTQVAVHAPVTVNFRGTLDVSEFWPSAPRLLRGTFVSVGLNNIFESYTKEKSDPPHFENLEGLTPGVNDARGRMYYIEFRKQFQFNRRPKGV